MMFLRNTLILCAFLITSLSTLSAQQHITSTTQAYVFPQFEPGKAVFEDGKITGGSFNYNVVKEEMVLLVGDQYVVFEAPDGLESVQILERKFIPVDKIYYEVLKEGKNDLLYLHKTNVLYVGQDIGYGAKSRDGRVQNVQTYGARYSQYELEVNDKFELEPLSSYVIRKGDSFEKFSNDRNFAKIFPNHKKQIKDFIKKNDLDFEKYDDIIKAWEFVKGF